MDGSSHGWFEDRRCQATLMVMIDDATNWTHAKFIETETTAAAMTVFSEYVWHYGRPRSLYVDRASIYISTRDSTVEEALPATVPLMQFGRALRELRVELILANSPQAKGRVERRHAVFQDRFVKALRLREIDTVESANDYLDQEYLDELNEKFHVTASSPANHHRPLPPGTNLNHILYYQEPRVVQNDWTVSWCNRIPPLVEAHQKLSLAKKQNRGQRVPGRRSRPGRPSRTLRPTTPAPTKAPYKPAVNHPCRR